MCQSSTGFNITLEKLRSRLNTFQEKIESYNAIADRRNNIYEKEYQRCELLVFEEIKNELIQRIINNVCKLKSKFINLSVESVQNTWRSTRYTTFTFKDYDSFWEAYSKDPNHFKDIQNLEKILIACKKAQTAEIDINNLKQIQITTFEELRYFISRWISVAREDIWRSYHVYDIYHEYKISDLVYRRINSDVLQFKTKRIEPGLGYNNLRSLVDGLDKMGSPHDKEIFLAGEELKQFMWCENTLMSLELPE